MKWIILFLLVLSFSLSAKIYKYKDSYGRVHYVDDISKVPSNRINQAKAMRSKFLKTDNAVVDKYRKLVSKKGVYYKELKEQRHALLLWANLMINYGFNEFKVDLERVSFVKFTNKKGKKLTRYQKRKVAAQLASYFKLFEGNWPKVYEAIHFKPTGNDQIDFMRKNIKTVKTNSTNLSLRIKLLEEWASVIKKDEKKDANLIARRMNKLSALYDVPKPNLPVLLKYVDKTIIIFDKEFKK